MKRAFIFPGQGSQYVGMGKDLSESYAEAREVFECVNDSLGQNLTKIMFDGDESDLNLTENTQPALMALSSAVVAVLEKQGNFDLGKICTFMAGHSLGEYAALTAAGSFALTDAAKILKIRGQAMQEAVPVGEGSMAAILGLNFNVVVEIASTASQDGQVCEVANDNTVGQVVISGHQQAVQQAVALATEQGAKRAVVLPVSAPFHCSLMAPAADVMAKALPDYHMHAPRVPIVSNVTAQAETEPDTMRELLIRQITGQVRWRESVMYMRDQGITEMIEIGAGKVLCGLVRRVDRDINTMAVETPEQIDVLMEHLQG